MTTKVEKNQINISSETAVSGGTTTSLVTTGEKYTWNNKQDSLPSQSGNSGKFLGTDGTSLSWQTVDALPSQTGQSGKYLTTDGTTASWAEVQGGGSVDIDNSTITTNSSGEIQTVGIKDVRTDNTLKTWTGTRAQYEAITTKDSNTLYNITDDTDVTSSLLDLLYPVGAIYIGTMASCPLATLGIGTWELIAEDRVLQGSSQTHTAGTTIEAGLPNITGTHSSPRQLNSNAGLTNASGAFSNGGAGGSSNSCLYGTSASYYSIVNFSASNSNSIYSDDINTVQPPAFVVNIWRRTE